MYGCTVMPWPRDPFPHEGRGLCCLWQTPWWVLTMQRSQSRQMRKTTRVVVMAPEKLKRTDWERMLRLQISQSMQAGLKFSIDALVVIVFWIKEKLSPLDKRKSLIWQQRTWPRSSDRSSGNDKKKSARDGTLTVPHHLKVKGHLSVRERPLTPGSGAMSILVVTA